MSGYGGVLVGRPRSLQGKAAVPIEHVGSPSVPGLEAKPIIDIQVSVIDVEDEDAYVPAIEALGVSLRFTEPGHRYFRPSSDQPSEGAAPCLRRGRRMGARASPLSRLPSCRSGGARRTANADNRRSPQAQPDVPATAAPERGTDTRAASGAAALVPE
jgi:hypothetical protein